MKLQRIKHILLRLSSEEKVLGIGALLVIAGAFLPWYSLTINFNEQSINESGFSGDLGVVGFIVFLLTVIALAFLLSDHLHIKIPRFGYSKERILLFLTGESAFLLLLTLAIYTKRSLEYTNAEIRFGLYMSLIGAVAGAFAAYAQIQKLQKKDAQEFFEHEEENEPEKMQYATDEPEIREKDVEKIKKHSKSVKAEQKGFFYEENGPIEDPIGDTVENPIEDAIEPDETPEEGEDQNPRHDAEVIEDPFAELAGENMAEPTESEDQKPRHDEISDEKPASQGGYFMREAGVRKKSGIKVDIESIRPVERVNENPASTEDLVGQEGENSSPRNKKDATQKMNFYDDL